jgi:hypothetical protein
VLYNDLITYNHNNITYTGTIKINVPGISSPIILGNVSVLISTNPDYSNATTIGFVTYDFAPNGILTIESTEEQAEALVSADFIYINSVSGEVAIQSKEDQGQIVVSADFTNTNSPSAEVSVESI